MGYYTDYVVRAENVYNPATNAFISDFLKNAWGGFYGSEGSWSIGETTWYKHEKDLLNLSSQPEAKDILFKVDGEGEESGDVWVKYFKNGKMVRYELTVTWPEFSEDDLK